MTTAVEYIIHGWRSSTSYHDQIHFSLVIQRRGVEKAPTFHSTDTPFLSKDKEQGSATFARNIVFFCGWKIYALLDHQGSQGKGVALMRREWPCVTRKRATNHSIKIQMMKKREQITRLRFRW
jgi:hypothetical protein